MVMRHLVVLFCNRLSMHEGIRMCGLGQNAVRRYNHLFNRLSDVFNTLKVSHLVFSESFLKVFWHLSYVLDGSKIDVPCVRLLILLFLL